MRHDRASGCDNGMDHILPGQGRAVAVEADSFVRGGDGVEEGIGRKAAAGINIFALSSRYCSWLLLVDRLQLTLGNWTVSDGKES